MLEDIAVLIPGYDFTRFMWVLKARAKENSRHMDAVFFTETEVFATDGLRMHIMDITKIEPNPFVGMAGAYEVIGTIRGRHRVYFQKIEFDYTHLIAGKENLQKSETAFQPRAEKFNVNVPVNSSYLRDASLMSDHIIITAYESFMYAIKPLNEDEKGLACYLMGMHTPDGIIQQV